MLEALIAIKNAVVDFWHWLAEFAEKLFEFLMDFPKYAFAEISEASGTAIGALMPDIGSALDAAVANIPSSAIYFLEPLNVGTGIAMLMGAYLTRFTIRRLPFVG